MSAVLKLVPTAHATYAQLCSINLDHVKRACLAHGIYSPIEIDRVEDEYRKYISLAVSNNMGGLPISRKLDAFWHTHIIFTQSYMAMCDEICGRYIHHRPKSLDDEGALSHRFAADTLGLYFANFGEPDPQFWDIVECACCDKCP